MSTSTVTSTDALSKTFQQVTENLLSLGALSLSKFATDDIEDILNSKPQSASELLEAHSQPDYSINPGQCLTYLHQTAHRLFGNAESLVFDVQEDHKTKVKRCTLTVTLPNNDKRVYQTEPIFARKNDAKAASAIIACQNGVIQFMADGKTVPHDVPIHPFKPLAPKKLRKESNHGEQQSPEHSTSLPPKTANLPPKPANLKQSQMSAMKSFSQSVSEIESLCNEWHGGVVIPQWYFTTPTKGDAGVGCVLKIQLTPNIFQVTSVEPTYSSRDMAQIAVANDALRGTALDLIRSQDDFKDAKPPVAQLQPTAQGLEEPANPPPPISLQDFINSLQPLPEPFDKGSSNNPVGWLNQSVQTAKGCKLSVSFAWIVDQSMHGCLLRLNRTGHDSISYLAEPRFQKRQDAKTAVVYIAISQGIVAHIARVKDSFEEKINTEMRRKASERVLPDLITEYRKLKPGANLPFIHEYVDGAHAARLTIDLGNDIVKTYHVPSDYKSKSDAKLALVLVAAQQGAFEFIIFRGRSPPEGYVSPYVTALMDRSAPSTSKSTGTKASDNKSTNKRSYQNGVPTDRDSHSKDPDSAYCGTQPYSRSSDVGLDYGPSDFQPSAKWLKGHSTDSSANAGRSSLEIGHPNSQHLRASDYNTSLYTVPSSVAYYGDWPPQKELSAPPSHNAEARERNGHYDQNHPPIAGAKPQNYRSAIEYASPQSTMRPGSRIVSEAPICDSLVHAGNHKDSGASQPQNVSVKRERSIEPAIKEEPDQKRLRSFENGITQSLTEAPSSSQNEATLDLQVTAVGAGPSYLGELDDFCRVNRMPVPTLGSETLADDKSGPQHKVWIIIGKEKFELPMHFATISEGKERVAKQVLARFKKQAKAT